MDKLIELGELLDWYGMLLTQKQRAVVEQYANENCSLSEIAEREGISRQGVRDALKRGEEQLRAYEQELKLVEKFNRQERLMAAMRTLIKESHVTDREKELLNMGLDTIENVWEE
ncbi:MAG: DNA-binding protein [Clostridia bacterium]|nr:DNA-binding protein [Clostridia bacterium]